MTSDLPELVCQFCTDIPDLPLRSARNPTHTDYILASGNLSVGQSLGETWEFENGDMVMLVYTRGILPPIGCIRITFEYSD